MSQENVQFKSLNIDKLNETFMNDSNIIKQILSSFQEAVASFEDDFNRLNNEKDHENLSRLVHGLKGSAGNIRAEKVAGLAAVVQQLIDQKLDYSHQSKDLLVALSVLIKDIDLIQSS